MSPKDSLLGLDPSFYTMGASLFFPETQKLELFGGDFDQTLKWISDKKCLERCIAVVENANLNSAVFGTWKEMKAKILEYEKGNNWDGEFPMPIKINLSELESTFARLQKKAQRIGDQKTCATQLIKLLRKRNVPILQIAPSQRRRADNPNVLDPSLLSMPTKLTEGEFESITGFNGRSTDDARDAAMLVWDRTIPWALKEIDKFNLRAQKRAEAKKGK